MVDDRKMERSTTALVHERMSGASRRCTPKLAAFLAAGSTLSVLWGCAGLPAVSQTEAAALRGQANFRDLGGRKASDGRRVKAGMLFRSGALDKLTDEDLAALTRSRIAKVIDFRLKAEAEAAKDRLPPGADYANRPVGMSGQALMSGDPGTFHSGLMIEAYRRFVKDDSAVFAEALKEAARPSSRPILWHCSAGKDRTGVASALVLLALGVPKTAVIDDYLSSNRAREAEVRVALAGYRSYAAGARGVPEEAVDVEGLRAVLEVRREYLEAAFDEMAKAGGSLEGYLRDTLAFGTEEQARLRDQLLER